MIFPSTTAATPSQLRISPVASATQPCKTRVVPVSTRPGQGIPIRGKQAGNNIPPTALRPPVKKAATKVAAAASAPIIQRIGRQ